MNRCHYVLIGPRGKQAGHHNQGELALQLVAVCLAAGGNSGGIVGALLPKTIKELKHIQSLLDRGYTFKRSAPKRGIREEIRSAAMSDELIVKLAVRFELEKRESPKAMHALMREFSVWICDKLTDLKPSDVKLIVEAAHHDLPNRTDPDWWRKQIRLRIQKLKK
jgi:hypothetical protein